MRIMSFTGIEKMNPIHSPVDGSVAEIFVDTCDTVRNRDVLLGMQ